VKSSFRYGFASRIAGTGCSSASEGSQIRAARRQPSSISIQTLSSSVMPTTTQVISAPRAGKQQRMEIDPKPPEEEELEGGRDEEPQPWAKTSSGDKDELVDDEGTGPDGSD
jgi:hypothetical protein